MNVEQGLLRQIVLWLWSRHRKAASTLSGKLSDLHDLISAAYHGFDDRELEKVLSKEKPPIADFGEHGKVLFLEPIAGSRCIVPILSMRYDFCRSIPQVRLRLALFLFDDTENVAAIGYRFESPEGEGTHHYYHAQLIRDLDRGHLLPCPAWLPTRQPAFALDAENALTLVVCLLIALYGLEYVGELQGAPFWAYLKTYVESKMMWTNRKFQPTYWQVTLANSVLYYKTWEEGGRFRAIMKNARRARSVEGISRMEYDAQAAARRKIH